MELSTEIPTPPTGQPWPCVDDRQVFVFSASGGPKVVQKALFLCLDGKVNTQWALTGGADLIKCEIGVNAFAFHQSAIEAIQAEPN